MKKKMIIVVGIILSLVLFSTLASAQSHGSRYSGGRYYSSGWGHGHLPTAPGGDLGSMLIRAGGDPIPILTILIPILTTPILGIPIMHLHPRPRRRPLRTANKNNPTTGITVRIQKVTTRTSRPVRAAG